MSWYPHQLHPHDGNAIKYLKHPQRSPSTSSALIHRAIISTLIAAIVMAESNIRVSNAQILKLGTESTIIRVGPEAKLFKVPTDLLRTNSAFFKAALSLNWTKSTEEVMNLPDDEPDVVEIYIHWLHARQIASKAVFDAGFAHEYSLLSRAIALGEKLQDVGFANALVDALITLINETEKDNTYCYPRPRHLRYIYEHTSQTAPVRRLLVDIWFWHAKEDTMMETDDDQYPHDFLVDLARKALRERAAQSDDDSPCNLQNRFRYHLGVENNDELAQEKPRSKIVKKGKAKRMRLT